MADQTTSSIEVDAAPSVVMGVIADFPAYPEWAGAFREVEVLDAGPDGRARRVRFVLDAGVFRDTYVLAYEWDADTEVRWTLVEGSLITAMDGAYSLESLAGGRTEVTYSLSVDVAIPMLGLMRRKAEKVVIDTALKGLKARVEQG